MSRKPVSIFKRPTSKKGQFRYYLKLWDEVRASYSAPRSAHSIVLELGLDERKFPSTSRTGALLIGQELLKRGGVLTRKNDPLFADYCASIWDWETSPYIQGKLARGQRIGKEHALHCAAYIKNHVRPAFPSLRLSAVRSFMLENFVLTLKKESGLGNRSINAIIDAMRTPLNEAVRLGLIPSNPASALQKMGNDTAEKGIPTDEEIRNLFALPLDDRIHCAILLGAVCGLRIGEIQALKPGSIEGNALRIVFSWGKIEGLKSTKTGKSRIVPLPLLVRNALFNLAKMNPHGQDGFFMYGIIPDKPLDVRAIERGFYKALEAIGINEDERKERNLSFHSLRHFANARLRGAVPDETLRKLTGHSTEAMTDHYDHTTEADLAALAKAQEARILPFIKTA